MLDKKTELMLQVANTLTVEDLDEIRASASGTGGGVAVAVAEEDPAPASESQSQKAEADEGGDVAGAVVADATRGQRERSRTRESKVSTGCLGKPREAHEWWPVGTELIGKIDAETFTAVVIENSGVKSGCSIQITSGAAANRLCLTPTRAAIEATEAYRQTRKLGRGGGITNGWSFWKPKSQRKC